MAAGQHALSTISIVSIDPGKGLALNSPQAITQTKDH